MVRTLLFLGLAFFSGIRALPGQALPNPKFAQFTTDQGLPLNIVWDIAQDRHGLLWMATMGGLSRFDGVNFTSWRGQKSRPEGPPDMSSFSFALDPGGRFWMGGQWGLAWYDEANDRFQYPFGFGNPKVSEVDALCYDGRETLWFRSAAGLLRMNTRTLALDSTRLRDANIIDIAVDPLGKLWLVAPPTELYRYDPAKDSFALWHLDEEPTSVFIAPGGEVWLCSSHGLALFDPASGHSTHFDPPDRPAGESSTALRYATLCPQRTGDSLLWVSTELAGLLTFHLGRRQYVQHFQHDRDDVGGLPTNRLTCLHWDTAGILWAGSKQGGLLQLNWNDQEFRQQRLNIGNTKVETLAAAGPDHPGCCWIGSNGQGVFLYDIARRQALGQWLNQGPEKDASTIYALHDDGAGNLWIGTAEGFYLLNNKVLQKIKLPLAREGKSYIVQILPGRSGEYLWLLTAQGPCRFDLKTRSAQLIPFVLPTKMTFILPFRKMWEDAAGALWIATFKGLYRVDAGTGAAQRFANPDGSFQSNYLNDLEPDAEGRLWLASLNGVLLFDPQSGRFDHVGDSLGERPILVATILTDAGGKKWVFGSNGNFRYDNATGRFERMTLAAGFVVESYNGKEHTVFPLGGQFASVDEGQLVLFDPLRVDRNPNPALPLVLQLKVNGRPFPLPADTTARLSLQHDQNSLLIDFTAANFTQPERTRFRYRLLGSGQDWQETVQARTANFANLPPGEYTFELMAANSAGVWDARPVRFAFHIAPPWWASWWFRLLALGTLGFTGYAFFQNRVKKIRDQSERREREAAFKQREAELQREVAEFKQQVAEVELAALRAQMNPHFVFNCLNSINTFILLNDAQNASDYLNKFSKLIRRVLDASRSEYVSLREELEMLRYYIELEQMRYGGRFQFRIDVDERLNPDAVDLPPMLVQPYVENAIWHGLMHREGNEGLLLLEARRDEKALQITIEDNGVGRRRAGELKSRDAVAHKSHGMQVTSERIKIINELYGLNATVAVKDLLDEAGEARGTRVVVRVPISR